MILPIIFKSSLIIYGSVFKKAINKKMDSLHFCLLFESINGFILNSAAQGLFAKYMPIFVCDNCRFTI